MTTKDLQYLNSQGWTSGQIKTADSYINNYFNPELNDYVWSLFIQFYQKQANQKGSSWKFPADKYTIDKFVNIEKSFESIKNAIQLGIANFIVPTYNNLINEQNNIMSRQNNQGQEIVPNLLTNNDTVTLDKTLPELTVTSKKTYWTEIIILVVAFFIYKKFK